MNEGDLVPSGVTAEKFLCTAQGVSSDPRVMLSALRVAGIHHELVPVGK